MPDLFIFGNCSSSYLALGLNRLREGGAKDRFGKIGYWAMPAAFFNSSENWEFKNGRVTIRNMSKIMRGDKATSDIFNYNIDNRLDAWNYLDPVLNLPLPEKDIIYIYSSPIFFYQRYAQMIQDKNGPPENLVRDIALHETRFQRQMLLALKELNCRVIVVEGPHPLPHEIDIQRYTRIYPIIADELKSWLSANQIPLLEYDEACTDAEGFTKEQYRLWPTDMHHLNEQYSRHNAERLLDFLCSNTRTR